MSGSELSQGFKKKRKVNVISGNVKEEMEVVRRSFYMERINLLRSRVEMLKGKDKALLKMYLDNGNTFRQMAQVAGVNEVTVARRIYRLIRRLLDGEYITCLRNRRQFTQQEMSNIGFRILRHKR